MIKINLPNPYEMSIPEFFAQMRIALKSAEKSYEEMVKGVELNNDNTPWISFEFNNEEIKSRLDEFEDSGFENRQDIRLEMNRL